MVCRKGSWQMSGENGNGSGDRIRIIRDLVTNRYLLNSSKWSSRIRMSINLSAMTPLNVYHQAIGKGANALVRNRQIRW